MNDIRACVSVKGRFHAFYLAEQLLKRGGLNQLITSYPKFEVIKYGIPKRFVTSMMSSELLSRGFDKLPSAIKRNWNPHFFLNEYFDRLAAMHVKSGANLFIGWSGVSLNAMKRAKKLGMVTVLERGSSHILYQSDILKEEYGKYGIKPNIAHTRVIEKELREYDYADYIEVPSSFSKKTFMLKGVSEAKIILGTRGVNLSEFKMNEKRDNVFRVVYCGIINIRKGVLYLLQAFNELKLANSELWLIGSLDPEMTPFLSKYNSRNIFLKGKIRQRELFKFYSQGTVFCAPSIEDGFGVVILQAMACGLPVICSPNSAGSDVIQDGINGFISPIRDVDFLKEKIFFLYKHPDKCKEMGNKAFETVKTNFTWDAYGDKIWAEYQKILKR